MRINLTVWLWVFVVMSLLLTVITVSMVYIFTSTSLKLPDPKYAFFTTRKEGSTISNPLADLESMGYRRTDVESMDWDLLWSHEYPFVKLSNIFANLKPHQKINHWPGNVALASKLELSTSNDFPFIPKSFKVPKNLENFVNYASSNPNKKFIQKNISHRNVSMVGERFDKESGNIFIQEFVPNPYLIDGYKFDIGVFVLLTSVNPLRLYIFDDVVLRFCHSKYAENDFSDKDTYVVRKNYLGIEAIPSLEEFYQTHNEKQSLDSFLRSEKKNPNLIWSQIENQLREVFLKRESKIDQAVKEEFSDNFYESFFELFKFDFLVTSGEDLKVWMMEGNMSPIFSPNEIMNNMVNMVQRQPGVDVNSKPLDPLVCKENNCDSKEQCSKSCELCTKCLTGRKEVTVKSAYRENHIEPRRFKRIFPKPISSDFNLEKELKAIDGEMNKFMTNWYFEKCRTETKWCQ